MVWVCGDMRHGIKEVMKFDGFRDIFWTVCGCADGRPNLSPRLARTAKEYYRRSRWSAFGNLRGSSLGVVVEFRTGGLRVQNCIST
jgi:hypothetical protein